MKSNILFRMVCIFCGVLMVGAFAGCGRKGDPRPARTPAAVSESCPVASFTAAQPGDGRVMF